MADHFFSYHGMLVKSIHNACPTPIDSWPKEMRVLHCYGYAARTTLNFHETHFNRIFIMPTDKFLAVWVSHSSISDFLACPRAYYLKNLYKDSKTGHKMTLMSPALALGQVVHSVLESLSVLPVNERFSTPLIEKFHKEWEKLSGKHGVFFDTTTEQQYKRRGEAMIKRVYNHPGPVEKLAVKISLDLPQYWLSEDEGIMLCGKIDWLEYLPESDSVHIIDFKTGQREEDPNSLQLPIYHLLVHNCQQRKVTQASYWYLERDDHLTEVQLPTLEDAHTRVLAVAQKIKLARQLKKFDCKEGGCIHCNDFERIIRGEGEFVGNDQYKRDVYILQRTSQNKNAKESVIL